MPIPQNAAYLFDIDNTLSDPSHRENLLGQNPSDVEWTEFFLASGADKPIESTLLVLRALQQDYKIIVLTGRAEIARDITVKWLKQHGIEYDELIMRQPGDTSLPAVFKKEAYMTQIKPKYTVMGTFDDSSAIATMWGEVGLTSYLQRNP
jgi:FMN phosphatase YigB (HAD superfamily)